MKDKNRNARVAVPELDHVPEEFHHAVLETLQEIGEASSMQTDGITGSRTGGSGRIRRPWRKRMLLPLAASFCLVIGGTVFASAQLNLYRQRMEEMNREMLDEFYATAYVTDSTHYSRRFTADEQQRMAELTAQYENEGLFPKGSVKYLRSVEEYKGKGVGFYADRGTMFLPDGELTDEELLQLIDFEEKVAYSVNKIGDEIMDGTATDYARLAPVAPAADGEAVVEYRGSVDAHTFAAGREYLYLGGTGVIERMSIGSDVSVPFYAADWGRNALIGCMAEDPEQGLYVSLYYPNMETFSYDGPARILHIDTEGNLLYDKEMDYDLVEDLAVDAGGRLYVMNIVRQIQVYDRDGEELCSWDMPYYLLDHYSMCRGKDGAMYVLCEKETEDLGIRDNECLLLRLDPDSGAYTVAAEDFFPLLAPHCSALVRGQNTDFVIFNYEGLYSYSLGDASAQGFMELYEAPLVWEGAACVSLEDGRIVFMRGYEGRDDGEGHFTPVPESIRFFYVETP